MTGPLTRATSLSQSDGFVIYSSSNIGFYFIPTSVVLEYLNANITFPGEYLTQYSSPSATGFSVTISGGAAGQSDTHLILTPVAGYATGTIVLPLATSCRDGQKVLVNCTQQVTTLTVSANGATAVTGEPSSLGADDFFTMKFDLPSSTWYRVG